jgi:hypothetical protein
MGRDEQTNTNKQIRDETNEQKSQKTLQVQEQ